MCLLLFFIVLKVLTLEASYYNFQATPVPLYQNALYYNPWMFQGMTLRNARFPYCQTAGPVYFGGAVRAEGGVTIMGNFANQGFGSLSSYSAPPTPLCVTPQTALPATSNFMPHTSLPACPTLPTVTSLPAVSVPSTKITQQFVDTMPSTVTVPTLPMPFIVVATTVANDVLSNEVSGPVRFSGLVPASGRVKISRHFF